MKSLKGHRWLVRISVMAVLALTLVAGHAMVIHKAFANPMLPMAALASVFIILALVIHLGLIGALIALVRRRLF